MLATLHLPGTAPRLLTAAELVALNPHVASGRLGLNFKAAAPALQELLGTAILGETLANGLSYLTVCVEHAADYEFSATPSATADFERLTGLRMEEDEPLLDPLLIIEAKPN